ncbi:MAG TPA: MarR family transcriptional regulator [Methylomirabilota bacterium]|jgi:DNA-binding MarR family transcriptional regulator|nr:MarR family transcriptional regulator [Methylomirabilota bacterium]
MSKRPTRLTQAEFETLASLRYALRRFLHFSEAAAEQAGLTPQQHQGLLAIKAFPARMMIGDLAERLQVRHHSAVGLADRLVRQHLAVRERDTRDRRQVYLSLTPRGEAMLEKLSVAHRAELRRVGGEIKTFLERLLTRPNTRRSGRTKLKKKTTG